MKKENMVEKVSLARRNLRYLLFAIFFLFFFIFSTSQTVFALPNPAAVYCQKMGYEYKVIKTPEGEKGVCVIPEGKGFIEFDAWEFFRGKVGQEYSYCAKQGYDTENERKDEGGFFTECAICVSKSKSSDGEAAERIPMLDLMEKNGEPLLKLDSNETDINKGGSDCKECRKQEEKSDTCPNIGGKENNQGSTQTSITFPKTALPTSFDWRDEGGHSYVNTIRDQSSCGSCYAFGAVASAEGVYNYAMGLFDGARAEFSESFIMWCLSTISPYDEHFGGCGGADWDYMELEALTDHGLVTDGICRLADFPYTMTDPGACTHWSDPLTVFSEWGRIPCSDIDAIKTAIMTYGVVDVAVDASFGPFNSYIGGIYSDSNTTCPGYEFIGPACYQTYTNHAVALVGWGDGYWILRNSWGTDWGEDGYMRIAYTSARVACEATYLKYGGPTSKGAVWLDRDSYPVPAVVNVTVWDSDLSDSVIVEITSDPTADTEEITLTETSDFAGFFTGYINLELEDASVGDSILQVAIGDTIIVTYYDEDDGTGDTAIVTDTAIISLLSPPTGLTATAGRTYVFLHWNAITDSALAGYNVYRSTSSIVTIPPVNGTGVVESNFYPDIYLSPNTTYYYWVTAVDIYDNETVYSSYIAVTTGGESDTGDGSDGGNGGNGGGSKAGSLSGCFIATACYGTPMAKEVRVLSLFRDEYLMTNSAGRFFVSAYYRTSPRIASFISEHPYLKSLVRWYLKPVVKVASEIVE